MFKPQRNLAATVGNPEVAGLAASLLMEVLCSCYVVKFYAFRYEEILERQRSANKEMSE